MLPARRQTHYQQYICPILDCQPALDFLYPYLVESSRIERA
jgi:hypothetical protein